MQQSSDVIWRPSGAKRHIARWLVGLGGVVAVLGYLNGGMPTEPDIKLPPKPSRSVAVSTVQLARTATASTSPRVEPVRILNPAPQPAPRLQAVARPSPRARADYQALRRELLSTD